MLEISHIRKQYRKHPVLQDINFHVEAGECLGLVGPNGCGKSTLLQILAGILRPDAGSVLFDGRDFLKERRLFSSQVGYVPQENPLFDDTTALDHLKLWYSGTSYSLEEELRSGFPARLKIQEFLHLPVRAMSGGMKKRLSLACALACRPPIVLMDEPAAALDLGGKEEIRSYIKALKEEGKIVLLATHEEADFPFCTALLLFREGTVERQPSDIPAAELAAISQR